MRLVVALVIAAIGLVTYMMRTEVNPVTGEKQHIGMNVDQEKALGLQAAPEMAEKIGDFNLRNWLKAELKANGEWGPIRVISTSCMDVCSPARVTVCLDPKNGDEPEVIIVDPVEEKHQLYGKIVDKLGKK